MPIIKKLRLLLVHQFVHLSAQTVLILLIAYFAISWLGLRLSGETDLVRWPDFVYYLIVTASTVGYGDMSPTTAAGRWVVSLFVIPLGLGLFALVIGRVAAFLSDQWRKGVRGLKTLDCDNHILVLGWNGQRTQQLLRLLLRETSQHADSPVVLLTAGDEPAENPFPDAIEFVKAASYSDGEAMGRAAIERARCIIVDSDDDNTALTAALYSNVRNPGAHLIAYFQDESLATLLKQHCPSAECAPSVAVEMLVKSAVDPGSSALHHKLLNVEHGQTQYSIRYPDAQPPVSVEKLFWHFKKRYRATLIGIKRGAAEVALNPPLEQDIEPGAVLYYIAETRIRDLDWNAAAG